MDGCSGKRNRNGIVVQRKEYNLVLRDKIDTKDENAQFCNRIGCSGRLKYTKSSPLDSAEKPKYSRPSIHSSDGKEIVGSSSRTCLPITSARSSPQDSPRKFSSHLESHSSKSSGFRRESHVTKLISTGGKNHQTQPQPKMRGSGAVKVTSTDVGSSCVGSKDTYKKAPCQKPQSGCENVLTGSSTDSNCSSLSASSDAPVSMGSATRNNRSGNRCGLRNLKCNSISDVTPRGGSPSETKNKRDVFRKRITEGESSSSSKGNRGCVAPSKEKHVFHSISGISITSSRQNRNWALNHDITSSVMTRRSVNANTRITSLHRDGITATVTEFQSVSPQSPRHEMHNNGNHTLPYLSSMGDSSNASSSYTLSEQTGDNVPGIVTLTSTEHGVTQGLRWHNLSGAAEVLLALERIEQDEELTYEQLLVLENNLFFGNLYFYDQHRDMRLDIDNMSYEELLALGDRMGTVSTAISEEAFTKCVKRTTYQTISLEVGCGGCSEDEADIKCSICQEEYAIGDEIGKLGCEHGYHVACLQQWLRLKNWCPICKASAAP